MRTTLGRFRTWFWRPPRAHGEIEPARSVSSLELFYDLVYVVVVAQAARHLAGDLSLGGIAKFAIVFGLIWFAWANGTQYYELHGREDGRTRTYVFLQMAILALLAVFTGDATGASGTAFALTYAAFLVVLAWLWYTVRRQDEPEFMAVTGQYLAGMLVSIAVIVASAFLPDDVRLVTWAVFTVGWLILLLTLAWHYRWRLTLGIRPTDSMVERFDLFTIIVLGEVVTGVVVGLSTIEHDVMTLGTGLAALGVGFGLWWVFFDFVGQRQPKDDGLWLNIWIESHLPITLAVAASGAAMAGLIEHAHDVATPVETAWLLAGSVAVCLAALAVTARSLADYERLAPVYQPLTWAMSGAAILAVLVGWWRPAPWLLAAALVVILLLLWLFAVERWLRQPTPEPLDRERPA